MKHLPRSSPHLVHDETKSFGSIPSPHPAAHDATVLDQHLYLTHYMLLQKKIKCQSIPNEQFES